MLESASNPSPRSSPHSSLAGRGRRKISHAAPSLLTRPWMRRVKRGLSLVIAGVGLPMLCGCSSVPAFQQRLVSKPNMLFNDSGAFVYQSKMWLQTEPGSMFSGGARAVGCSACAQ